MEIEYALDETDLIALARFQVDRSPTVRRRFYIQWLGYVLGFILLGLGTYLAFSSTILLFSFGSLAVVSFVVYPFYFRWAGERRIRQIVHERVTPSSLAKRVLRATPEGLEQIMGTSESKVKWELVNGIEVIPTHAFISIDGTFSIVIPRLRLGESQFQGFLDTIRQHMKNTAA
jgi:hypothetical protein